MMSKLGPHFSTFHPRLDVKSNATVDELLACEVRRYVIFCIFNVFLHICYDLAYMEPFADLVCARLKSDGVTPKNVKLFGTGFLNLVDHYFWHLPFASMKQAHSVRQKANVPEEEWETRWGQIVAEHDTEGAREQLAEGWKAWLAERVQKAGDSGAGGPVVSSGSIDMLD